MPTKLEGYCRYCYEEYECDIECKCKECLENATK